MRKKKLFRLRIDKKVCITMLVCSIASLLVLSFNNKNAEPCSNVDIEVQAPDSCFTGSLIFFKVKPAINTIYQWNFDDSTQSENGSSVSHIYKKAGVYIVTLLVNGKCSFSKEIIIGERKIVNKLQVNFTGPDTVFVDSPAVFRDITLGATKWEWRVGDLIDVFDTAQQITYKFTDTGRNTVYLKVNDDNYFKTMIVFVKRNPVRRNIPQRSSGPKISPVIPLNPPKDTLAPPPPPPPPKPLTITEDQVISLMNIIIDKNTIPDEFSKYFCNNTSVEVVYNSSKMKFSEMCEELKKLKLRRVKSLHVILYKDASTGCIQSMNVTLKKKSFPF